jgi:RNA exonuclease 1
MLKTLYDHFVPLYSTISPLNPTLAADHALKQEGEVYEKSNKLTYRNVRLFLDPTHELLNLHFSQAVISCVAAIKRRPQPDSLSHASVGTEDDIKQRAEKAKSLKSLVINRANLEKFVLTREDMERWGYMLEPPDGEGGEQPHLEGSVAKCERCAQPFQVTRTGSDTECLYHWGKQQTAKAGGMSMNISPPCFPLNQVTIGEKIRVYTCCSRPAADSEGCVHGRHVFYESAPEDLHSRHPFSFLQPPAASSSNSKVLQVAAMDCEMIYTTGGFRVARVSVVDGKGKEVFDEVIQMDEDVHVM